LPNLIKFCNSNINTRIKQNQLLLKHQALIYCHILISFNRAWQCSFNDTEVSNLRNYLVAGGLHIDDNYGMDHIKKRNKENFPNTNL
jgi:hypothetical protein